MRIYYLSTLFLLIHFSAFNQDFSQGVVYSSENLEAIKGAHIFNVSNDKVDFTSEGGKFKIEASYSKNNFYWL